MRKLIPLLGLLTVLPAFADDIYKWVDEDGQTHFSDVPRDGAELVEIGSVQTFSLPGSATSSTQLTSSEDSSKDEEAMKYDALVITSPGMEETIWNTGGLVTVGVRLQPGLMLGHRLVLQMDEQRPIEFPSRSSTLQLTDVARGEHKLRAEVQDENGKVVIVSDTVTIFYQQTSVNRR